MHSSRVRESTRKRHVDPTGRIVSNGSDSCDAESEHFYRELVVLNLLDDERGAKLGRQGPHKIGSAVGTIVLDEKVVAVPAVVSDLELLAHRQR